MESETGTEDDTRENWKEGLGLKVVLERKAE